MNADDGSPTTTEYSVPGLEAEVEIVVDRWGVPHLYAQSTDDVYLAQGFNAARDRLFQIDVWLRRGNGRLAEALGSGYLQQDAASRLLRYRGGLESEWAAYGVDTRRIVTSFVTGYNAYVDHVLAHPELLPPEFEINGFLPRMWEAEDIVRFRTHGLLYNAEYELARAITLTRFGAEAERIARVREPDDALVFPRELDLGVLSDEVLAVYRRAFAPVDFAAARFARQPDTARAAGTDAADTVGGSNSWVVGPERTATGRPLLANDPHRGISLPALRYLAHLTAPGLDVIGAGEPGLPGISIGHNENVGFGLTIWAADVEDLYIYELDPADPERYRGAEGWEQFRTVQERIPVRDAEAGLVELRYSGHGPVLFHDEEAGIAVALRAAWLEPGMTPYLGSLRYLTAQNAEEFSRALQHWGTPAVNQVFADVAGDWGWQASGRIPHRDGWDGSLPVAGHSGREWAGLVGSEALPSSRRPAEGWIATANEMNLPHSWDNGALTATYDWYPDGRYRRLRGWLSGEEQVSVAGSFARQLDFTNGVALRALDSLRVLDPEELEHGAELARLFAWDGVESTDSREALVFQIWWRRHLRPRLLERHLRSLGVGEGMLAEGVRRLSHDESAVGDLRGELRILEALDPRDTEAVSALRADVDAALGTALAEIRALVGDDESGWRWGAVHHGAFLNTALLGTDAPAGWQRLGPVERGGGPDTVGLTSYEPGFRQVMGSSFRMVLDVGNWDASLVLNGPGQAGDPRSPHYSDHLDAWASGEGFPLAYSRGAVEAAAEQRILLRPAG
ncbi:penicillin acylase family protein [Microbacterium sp. 10M-3C3]|jgi:penicillin amidase|uniref:penicillin acylase family protein n=1 Tax=Microbacterium sp. 10M-3C3 TaxID=2483401 RepID=UPI000F63DEEC|nr:penicillin acylase family protein [Microbacterium sp. 10M-3C3]